MWDDRDNDLQIFDRTLGTSGEIDDECFAANSRDNPRQHGMRRDYEAGRTHGLRETGRFSVNDSARGFGSDIARRKASSSGGEDHVHLAAI